MRTTNNRQELLAVINGLRALKRPCRVTITTDSKYVVNGFTKGWLEAWKRRGWRTTSRKPVKNQELWEQLEREVARHEVSWVWTRAHAGDPHNERCDHLAVAAAAAAARRSKRE